MNDEIAEARLVLRSQAGDREALEALLRRVQQPLWRYATERVGRRHVPSRSSSEPSDWTIGAMDAEFAAPSPVDY